MTEDVDDRAIIDESSIELERAIDAIQPSKSSISAKILHFFTKVAAWPADTIGVESDYSSIDTKNHKITFNDEIASAKRVVDILQSVQHLSDLGQIKPRKQEIDAFRLKALMLLQQQGMVDTFNYEEAIGLIHRTDIETAPLETVAGTLVQLHQVISNFPGEEFEVTGLFRRDSAFSDISIPVKESFQLTKSIHQSGFPHPGQYIGMAFHELLLPQLQIQQEIAKKLLPKELFNRKAKKLLRMRCSLFNQNSSLRQLQKTYIQALCQTSGSTDIDAFFESLEQHPFAYEELSNTNFHICQHIIAKPIAFLRHEWLVNKNPEISTDCPEKAFALCKLILETQIEEECSHYLLDDSPKARYQATLGKALGKAVTTLYVLQLSQHLGFPPPLLTRFEKAMLTSLFRQQLVFADELQNVPDDISIELFEEYLVEQLEEEIALFDNISSFHPQTQAAIVLTDQLLNKI